MGAVRAVVSVTLLERPGQGNDDRPDAFAIWKDWSPAASFLHFSTKDAHAPIEPEDSLRELRQRARIRPMPSSVKSYPRARQFRLPPPQREGEFPDVLLARRTWREFSPSPVPLAQLCNMLGLSFG